MTEKQYEKLSSAEARKRNAEIKNALTYTSTWVEEWGEYASRADNVLGYVTGMSKGQCDARRIEANATAARHARTEQQVAQ